MCAVGNLALATPPAAQRVLRVLVVDDVEINRELLCLLIKQQGLVAEQADDGAAAVERVAAGGIDLVFMDVQMPGIDGLEATRQIRQLAGAVARTPVWAVTAQVLPEHVAQCLDAGMEGHFSKPVSLVQIRDLLLALQDARAAKPPSGSASDG